MLAIIGTGYVGLEDKERPSRRCREAIS